MLKRSLSMNELSRAASSAITHPGILDALPSHIALLDAQGNIIVVNRAWQSFAEQQQPEDPCFQIGQNYLSITNAAIESPGEGDVATAIRRVLAGHAELCVFEYPCRCATGKNWFRVSVAPVRHEAGAAAVVMHVDITQGKRFEETLQLSEERFRLMVEGSEAVMFYTHDRGHLFDYLSPSTAAVLGYSPDELLGQHCDVLVIPDDPINDDVHVLTEQALLDGKPCEPYYTAVRHKAGHRIVLEILESPLFRDGTISGIQGFARDITDRVDALDSVRISEARFRGLFEQAAVGMVFASEDGRILQVNDCFAQTLGYTPGELVDYSCVELTHPGDRERESRTIGRLLSGELDRDSWEKRYLHRNGTAVWCNLTLSMLPATASEARQFVGVALDMSERHQLEEQLRQSQRLESVGQLTGGVAHDFNNLLTVILGNADLLSEGLAEDAGQRELADMIASAAQRGAELTNRLLAFARRQVLDPKVVQVDLMIADFDRLLHRTLGEHITIDYRLDADLWPAMVDAAQLESALLNLCINARDAMPGGGRLTIAAANKPLDHGYTQRYPDVQPGDYVMVAVSDSGTGIAPGLCPCPFFTTKEKGKGTGLGLAMVYGFLKQSGGHVSMVSALGSGTTVKLYLPRAKDAQASVNSPRKQAASSGGDASILLVEDDELVRQYANGLLLSLGYRVKAAANGKQALELLRTEARFDLLFTDVVMPGNMSGRQLADEAVRLRPGLKVLYTSGYTDDAIVHHGVLDPDIRLLSKPYRSADLARALSEMLEQTD